MKKKLALLLVVALSLTAVLGLAPMASAEEAVVEPATVAPEIEYFNISLRVGATLLFAVPADGFTVKGDGTVDNLKLLLTKDSDSKGIGGVADGLFLDASGKTEIGEKTYIVFAYSGLAANEMADIVYARSVLVTEGGRYIYGEAKGYSVTEFVDKYEGTDEGTNSLIASLLAYGDAAIAYKADAGVKANYRPSESKSADLYTISVKRVLDGAPIDEGFELNQYAKAGEVALSVPHVYGATATSFEGATVTNGKVTVSGNLEITINYTTDAASVHHAALDLSSATVGAYNGIAGSSGTVPGGYVIGTAWGASGAHAYNYGNFTIAEEDGVKCFKFAHNGACQANFGNTFVGTGMGDSIDFSIQLKVKANANGTFPRTEIRVDRIGNSKGEIATGSPACFLILENNGDIVLQDLNGNDAVLGKGDATKFQTITVVCDVSEGKFVGYIDGVKCGETDPALNPILWYASHKAGVNTRLKVTMYGGYQASYWNGKGIPAELVGEGKSFQFAESADGTFILDKVTGLYRVIDGEDPADIEEYKDATKYAISYTAGADLQNAIKEYVEANDYFYFTDFVVYKGDVMAK